MKKMISILIATLMLLTSVSVFADATRPAALTIDAGTKVDTTDVDVTAASTNTAEYNTQGGTWSAMFDGNGMVGGYIGGVEANGTITEGMNHATALTEEYKFTGRWYLTSNTAKPQLEIKLSSAALFNTIKWTEVRDLISGYTFEFYNGTELVHTYSDTLTVGNVTSANMVLRTINLDKNVTADKIIFKVTAVKGGSKPSIAEMEFWNSPKAPTATDAVGTEIAPAGTKYEVGKAFDGVYYDGRFVFEAFDDNGGYAYTLPITISFDLGNEKTFNYAQLVEGACALGEIDVEVSNDGIDYDKVGTMPRLDEYIVDGKSSIESIHSISFDSVTARYVKYVIREIVDYETLEAANLTKYTVAVSEIALFNYPAVSEGKEAVIYPVIARGTEYTEEFPVRQTVNTHVTISNDSESSKNYILVGALYNDGILADVTYKTVAVEAGKTRTFSVPSDANDANITKQTVSFFAWDTTLVPLAEAVSLSK